MVIKEIFKYRIQITLKVVTASAVLLSLLFSLLLLSPAILYSQDTSRADRNINKIDLVKSDPRGKSILPHRLVPVAGTKVENYEDSLARAQFSISKTITNHRVGNIAMALFYIHDAILYCPPKEIRTYTIAHSYYAIIQIKLGNYSTSVNALNMCDSTYQKMGDLNLMAFHSNNMGLFYRKFKTKPLAEEYFSRAYNIAKAVDDKEIIALSLNNLSQGTASIEKRESYLKEAIDINKQSGNSYNLAENYLNISKIYLTSGRYRDAMRFVDLTTSISQESSYNELLFNSYELRSEIYAAMGNYRQAYESNRKMSEIKERIEGVQSIGDVESIIQGRILSKKNFELNLQKKELDIKKLNQTLIVTLSLLVISVLLLLYIYYFINSRRKLQCLESKHMLMEQQKQYVESELVNIATYLSSRNELLDNIQASLTKTYKLPEKEILTEIRKINLHIRNLQSKNSDVESVLMKIGKINEGFIARLTQDHPDLTKNDKNIALFLRANLSTKQIATLMDCSPKSVNMARYRMRTHLSLSSDTNLVEYLKSL
jgi:tetratricopeptide (TPR) repeat protein/DNA-binding CsgD family transcriptional regulator